MSVQAIPWDHIKFPLPWRSFQSLHKAALIMFLLWVIILSAELRLWGRVILWTGPWLSFFAQQVSFAPIQGCTRTHWVLNVSPPVHWSTSPSMHAGLCFCAHTTLAYCKGTVIHTLSSGVVFVCVCVSVNHHYFVDCVCKRVCLHAICPQSALLRNIPFILIKINRFLCWNQVPPISLLFLTSRCLGSQYVLICSCLPLMPRLMTNLTNLIYDNVFFLKFHLFCTGLGVCRFDHDSKINYAYLTNLLSKNWFAV